MSLTRYQRLLKILFSLSPALLFLPTPSFCSPTEQEKRLKDLKDLENKICAATTQAFRSKIFSKAAITINHNGASAVECLAGASSQTPFSLASVTKPLTSLAILQLVDRGLLSLNHPVSTYIPQFEQRYPQSNGHFITIKDLLQHLSGISYNGAFENSAYYNQKVSTMTAPSKPAPLLHQKFMYSNINYKYLAQIIEKVSHSKYPEYMKTQIFEPLGLTDTTISPQSDGASGIMSSARDLSKIANMFLKAENRNKNENQYTQLITVPRIRDIFQIPSNVSSADILYFYGLGWRTHIEKMEVHSFYHTGIWKWTFADLRIFPVKKSSVVFLANPEEPQGSSFSSFRWNVESLSQKYMQNKTLTDAHENLNSNHGNERNKEPALFDWKL